MIDIKDMLLHIAKLYQMKDFDPESSVLLAEWIMEEYQHTDYEVVKNALSKPPIIGKEKTWRLTPEVISEWIDVTRQRMIFKQERTESEKRQISKTEFPRLSGKVDMLLDEAKSKLAPINEPKKKVPMLDLAVPFEQSKTAGHINTGNERQAKLRELVLKQKGARWNPKQFFDIDGLKVPGDSIEEAKRFIDLLTP